MLLYKTQKPRGCLSFRLLYGILISALSRNVKRLAPCFSGDFFFPGSAWKGGMRMVTYSDLIQIGILVVAIIALFMQANKKK